MEIVLFRGSENPNLFGANVFFSTSIKFSERYGAVKKYLVNLSNVFDTLNETHINMLLSIQTEFYEPYDGLYISTYDDYVNTPSYGSDNWEMFEQYISSIKSLGFDSMKIFEGGYENYCVFHKDFKVID